MSNFGGKYAKFIYLFIGIFIGYMLSSLIMITSYMNSDDSNNTSNNYFGINSYNNVELNRNDMRYNNNTHNKCHLPTSLKHKIYVYDLPKIFREDPRREWYRTFYKLNYDKLLNFGFGKKLIFEDGIHNDYYSTHMHSLEITMNERMKYEFDYKKHLTKNPDEAELFIIPFPFSLHHRFYGTKNDPKKYAKHIQDHHDLYKWLTNNPVYVQNIGKKPHVLLFCRIAYETGHLKRRDSPFFLYSEAWKYWILSIDRNCHGDPPLCWQRLSMPHPSIYHPTTLTSLQKRINYIKNQKRDVLVSFCGSVRTKSREEAMDHCKKMKFKRNKFRGMWNGTLCEFIDSESYRNSNKHKRAIEISLAKQCIKLYERSVFCIQEGADSNTRKGIWDGIISGCIPVFLNGVMTEEFDCYGRELYPWYVVVQSGLYVKQLIGLSDEYISLMKKNILKLLPRIVYTNGNSGWNDAFDVILMCLLRKSRYQNIINDPNCNIDDMIKQEWWKITNVLGYDKLNDILGIQ